MDRRVRKASLWSSSSRERRAGGATHLASRVTFTVPRRAAPCSPAAAAVSSLCFYGLLGVTAIVVWREDQILSSPNYSWEPAQARLASASTGLLWLGLEVFNLQVRETATHAHMACDPVLMARRQLTSSPASAVVMRGGGRCSRQPRLVRRQPAQPLAGVTPILPRTPPPHPPHPAYCSPCAGFQR